MFVLMTNDELVEASPPKYKTVAAPQCSVMVILFVCNDRSVEEEECLMCRRAASVSVLVCCGVFVVI